MSRKCRYSPEQIEYAMQEYLKGRKTEDIAGDPQLVNEQGQLCSARTIRRWAAAGRWSEMLERLRANPVEIQEQLNYALERLKTAETTTQRYTESVVISQLRKMQATQKKRAPAPAPRPVVQRTVHREVFDKIMTMFWYKYQIEFLLDDSRFICIFKSRQIGFSRVISAKILAKLMGGRNQLYVSASQEQADIVVNYVRSFAIELGLEFDGDSNSEITINGAYLKAFSTNFRTIQGFNGDVTFDEFAWLPKAQQVRIWNALVPSITTNRGTITVCSTAFIPNTLFYNIVTNKDNQYHMYHRYKLTIEDAIEQGMEVPGGLEELRSQFDSESWQMLYMCEWADSGDALLSWDLLQKAAAVSEKRTFDGIVFSGVDVGRKNDRTVVANIGETGKPNIYQLLHVDMLPKDTPFSEQEQWIHGVMRNYKVKRMQIDRTGIGYQLAENMVNTYPDVVSGRSFSRQYKERLALNLLKMVEEGRLLIPNDQKLLSQLHAVKKIATPTGISYDAARDELGHADMFWAVALAGDRLAKPQSETRVFTF